MSHDLFEEFRVSGRELIERVRELLKEGNIRRMVIKNSQDDILFELPLALGVAGVGGAFAIAPILSAIATFAFFVNDARIIVERYPESDKKSVENELLRNRNPYDRKKNPHSRKNPNDRDPYEIDTDFEIINP